jgi:hypothetical protein
VYCDQFVKSAVGVKCLLNLEKINCKLTHLFRGHLNKFCLRTDGNSNHKWHHYIFFIKFNAGENKVKINCNKIDHTFVPGIYKFLFSSLRTKC